MQGKIQKTDDVNGRVVELPVMAPLILFVLYFCFHLFLYGKSGVEEGPFWEIDLLGLLHLHDEAGAVLFRAFNVEIGIMTVDEWIDFPAFLLGVGDTVDGPFRNQFAQDVQDKTFIAFRSPAMR